MEYVEIDIPPFVMEIPLECSRCGATQLRSEMRAVEIVQSGKETRIEFHGKIRPQASSGGIVYSCLVCGHTWFKVEPPEDPTPGGASVAFLHPVHEGRHTPSCEGICFDGPYGVDRDAC
jgi:hypothetical protein